MKKVIKLSVPFLVMVLVFSFFLTPQASAKVSFADVPTNAEYNKHVELMVNKKLISGYQEKGKMLYKPANTLTRFHVAKILVEATGKGNMNVPAQKFSDLQPRGNNIETHRYLSIAVHLGYLDKGKNNSISPYAAISRADMAKALAKAFNLEQSVDSQTPMRFNDVASNATIAPAINGLYYSGIADGSVKKFYPQANLTRSQFALFVGRVLSDDLRLSIPSVAIPFSKGQVFGTGSSLNVRTSPNEHATIKGKLKDGDAVTLIKVQGSWYEVKYGSNQTGFVHSKYIKKYEEPVVSKPEVKPDPKPEEKPTAPLPVANLQGKVTVNSLNIRQSATTSSAIVGKLSRQQLVNVNQLNGSWAHITTANGTKGYVNKTYLKLKNTKGNPLANRIIVIDAGHGGSDPGAQSSGVNEKDITFKVSKLVEQKLRSQGVNVKMTRTDDSYLGLTQRTDYAKKVFGETFVSIHVNSFDGPQANGTEVFFDMTTNDNSAESNQLAKLVQSNIVKDLNMTNRGVKTAPFAVLRSSNIPSILIELGFISNASDRDKMTNDRDLNKFADAIVNGLYSYYSN